MKHFLFVFSPLMLSTAVPLLAQAQEASELQHKISKHPNIIMIITDQQRGDAIGCSGNKSIITPNMDKLAKDGVYFSNAYSCTPSSTPARAALLTGMSPWQNGMLGYGNVAEHYKYEMPQMLDDIGYNTMVIGKNHFTPQNATHGYQVTILDESGRVESPYFMSDYRKWFHVNALGLNPDSTGLKWNDHRAWCYKLPEDVHPTKWTGDEAVTTIEHYQSPEPLFLKISFARPHSPYDAPQRVFDEYKNIDMPAPAIADWSKRFGPTVTDPNTDPESAFGNFGIEYAKNVKKHYYASITFVDEQIGHIIQALKDRGMYDNSVIMFVSDHGDMMGDHNHWRKTFPWQGSVHIPLIIKFPQDMPTVVKPNERVEQPVELRDVLPTFLAINGVEQPKEMDGMSMLRLVEQKNPKWRKWIDLEHSACYSPENHWCGLTDGKMKYIFYFSTGAEQLFDLQKDPQEIKELSKDKKYSKQLLEMRKAMAEHLSVRGSEWEKNGTPIARTDMLYSPNYPKKEESKKKKK